MTLSYTLQVDDLVAATVHMQGQAKPKRRPLSLLAAVVSWAFWLLLVGFFLFESNSDILRIGALVLFVALWLLNHRSVRQALHEDCIADLYRAPGNDIFLGRRTIVTSPDGFTVVGALSESRYPWAVVFRVARSPKHIFIYIAPGLVHAVPLTTGLTSEDIDSLWSALQGFVPSERFVAGT